MSILKQARKIFKFNMYENSSSEIDISELFQFSTITIPSEYLDIIREKSEIEVLVYEKKYLRIWGAKGCIDMNSAYNIQNYVPHSLAVGDDECGNALIYAYGDKGFGIYMIAFNNLDLEGMLYISSSLYDFFVNGKGVQEFIHFS